MAEAALDITLGNVTLVAEGVQELDGLNVVLDDVVCEAIAFKEIWASGEGLVLQRVTVVATGVLGEAPPIPNVARIYNLTGKITEDGGAILCFVGPAFRSVEWRILDGYGEITPFTTFTDEHGQCSARFDSLGIVGKVLVGVAYVP